MNEPDTPPPEDRKPLLPTPTSIDSGEGQSIPVTTDPLTPRPPASGEGIARVVTFTQEEWSGPLPSPNALAAFGSVSGDFPDRIVSMAELEQRHRHEMRRRDADDRTRGQILAFGIALVLVISGATLVWQGHPISGTFFGGTTLAWVVTAFIRGRSDRHASQLPPPPSQPSESESHA